MRAPGTVLRVALLRGWGVLLDLLYPPHCVACGRFGAWLCSPCADTIAMIRGPLCDRCLRPVRGPGLCSECRDRASSLHRVRAVSLHVYPLRECVHALKYEGLRALAEPLGDLMARYWARDALPVDVVVPVPLHSQRVRQRGYNQALLLAEAFVARTGLPLERRALVRERNTRSQVGLSRPERRSNVAGAFECHEGAISGKHVLLVDDVYTTGATLEACAEALRAGGASRVSALTLTRATDGRTGFFHEAPAATG